jgi:hypothetical protein
MITVEVPVRSLVLEIDRLQEFNQDHEMESRGLYVKGAIDALTWIVNGGDSPSHNREFPIFAREQ